MFSNLAPTLLVASALLKTCSAAVIPSAPPRWDSDQIPTVLARTSPASPPEGCVIAPFQVTGYDWGCSPGGCSNSFNVSAPADYKPGAPAFSVHCAGIYVQRGWVDCTALDRVSPLPPRSRVQTIWTDGPDRDRQYIGVAHIYQTHNDPWVNASGYTSIVPQHGMGFNIPVTNWGAIGPPLR